jgi:HPt (histidine-containing phosphotransfer) domain-containing protein
MDINVDKLKLEYIAEKIQVLLIDGQGFVAESCDSVFPFSGEKESLFAKVPFFDRISRVLSEMNHEDPPLCFDRTELDFKGKHCICDVLVSKKFYGGRELYELVIENKTLYYQFYEQMQAQSDGNSSYLELLNEQIALRNEIERLRTEEKKRWQQQKRTFLFQLAAHLEQPLANALALIAHVQKNPDKAHEWFKPLSASVGQIEEIRQYVLDLAAPFDLQIRSENFSLPEILEQLQDVLSARLLKNVHLKVTADERIAPVLRGDVFKLKQILYFFCEFFLQTSNELALAVGLITENKNEQLVSFEISGKATALLKSERWQWAEKVAEAMGGKVKFSPANDKISFFIPLALPAEKNENDVKISVLFAAGESPDETAMKTALIENGFDVVPVSPKILAENIFPQNNNLTAVVVREDEFSSEQLETLRKQFEPHFFVIASGASESEIPFFALLRKPVNAKTFIRKIKQSYTINYMEKIDLSYIRDIVDNQPELIAGMLKILEKNLREYPVLMHKELENGNLKALRETAHKFKSSTAYTGLTEFNQTLNRIELCEEQNLSLEEVKSLVDEIAVASLQIRHQVEELIKQQLV